VGEAENRRAVERVVEGLNAKNVATMNEVFRRRLGHVVAAVGRGRPGPGEPRGDLRCFPSIADHKPYRMVSSGDLVVAEAVLD
jgi:hypothetical protein